MLSKYLKGHFMSIQDIVCFIKAAECHSIPKAAAELDRTYQGVHKSISNLESELGAPLFQKSGRMVLLTDFGKYVLDTIAKPLLEYWNALPNSLNLYQRREDYILRFGIFEQNYNINRQLKSCCSSFIQQYPNVKTEFISIEYSDAPKLLAGAEIDLAFCTNQYKNDLMQPILYFQREIAVFLSDLHPLSQKSGLSISDISDYSIQINDFKSAVNQDMFTAGILHEQQCVAFDKSNPLAFKLLQEGLLLRIMLKEHASAYPYLRPISFDPPLYSQLYLVYYKDIDLKPSLMLFLEFLKETGSYSKEFFY